MKLEEATLKVEEYIAKEEEKMNSFGSALPGYVNPNIKLRIISNRTETHDFGWVFYYGSTKFIETDDFMKALGGNPPIIINKRSGELVETGTAYDTPYYIDNYIKTGDPQRES